MRIGMSFILVIVVIIVLIVLMLLGTGGKGGARIRTHERTKAAVQKKNKNYLIAILGIVLIVVFYCVVPMSSYVLWKLFD